MTLEEFLDYFMDDVKIIVQNYAGVETLFKSGLDCIGNDSDYREYSSYEVLCATIEDNTLVINIDDEYDYDD